MNRIFLLAALATGLCASVPSAHAAACANGVYRAGCAGPNGAAVVRKPAAYPHGYYHPNYYHRPPPACASGPYRAGCAGPHGAAVVRRPY
jgi:hypothetical protein